MARKTRVEAAKRRFLAKADARPWLRAVGIGQIDSELGLVISVTPTAKGACRRIVNGLDLDVPVRIRGVEPVRARAVAARTATARSASAQRGGAERSSSGATARPRRAGR